MAARCMAALWLRHNLLMRALIFVQVVLALAYAASEQTSSRQAGTSLNQGIDVRINGTGLLRFGLDTGAADFFITPGKARELGLPVMGSRAIRASDRQPDANGDEAKVVQAATLRVAGYTFRSAKGVVLPNSHRDGDLGYYAPS